jgi:diadenosine tetraphosphatase ApaH/serine/threonine PP2A family protein phosphatase
MAHVQNGAIAVLGNHDDAVAREPDKHMTAAAREAAAWTRSQLDQRQLQFLADLPLTAEHNNCLFVHASAAQPRQWEYITGITQAINSMDATHCRITFCGHVHEPALYNLSPTGKVSSFVPTGDSSIPLGSQRHWLVIPGSVGQPRDGNPAACYALFDDVTHDLTYFRVPYDHETAAAKIRAAGLPPSLGTRLEFGL